MTKARFSFHSPDGRCGYLTFALYPHAVAHRWVELVKRSQKLGASFEAGEAIYGGGFVSRDELAKKIQDTITYLTPHYEFIWKDKKFDLIRNGFRPDQDHANMAHIFFEDAIHSHQGKSPDELNPEILSKLHFLNRYIHQFEVESAGNEGFFIEGTLWNSLRGPLSPDENKLFSLDKKWGELYLSYCHIGVSYLEAFETRYPEAPTPQNQMSGNVVFYFQSDMPYAHRNELKKWLEDYWKRPVELQEFPLGHLPLGKIEWEGTKEELKEFFTSYPHLGKEVSFL